MARVDNALQLHISSEPHKRSGTLIVTVPAKIIDKLYEHTLKAQKNAGPTVGFSQQEIPIQFLDSYYHENLISHLKEFLLKYTVISFVYRQLVQKKILTIGEPRLIDIFLEQHKPALYKFTFTTATSINARDWKRLPFKAPQRKRYQDIDKQVANFLAKEQLSKKNNAHEIIEPGDWVLFEVTLVNSRKKPLINNFSEKLWIQLNNEEAGEPFRTIFLGKHAKDSFLSDLSTLTDYFGSQLTCQYKYLITICQVLPAAYFCIDTFKNYFRLSSTRKAHKKMVEVYSFCNDMSLRRLLVEEALTLLLKTYPLEIPESSILRQEKIIFDELQQNPDYTIYKLQHDFNQKVRSLAEKQVREELITLLLAAQENLSIKDHDIFGYINLTKRPRTKEFLHFLHPAIKANDEDSPLSYESIKYYCLHEKTLNYILHHLMSWYGE